MKMYGNDPAIPLLCIHPEETRTKRDTCTSVFTAALVTSSGLSKVIIVMMIIIIY